MATSTGFPDEARGAVILRTQGRRLPLLAEALASVAAQASPVTAFVVVHGGAEALHAVREAILGIHNDVRLLQAPDTGRLRGYPLNVALDAIYRSPDPDRYAYLFFLDDDDRIYPRFCSAMTVAFQRYPWADVVYAGSNRRAPGHEPEPGYAPLPIPCLLHENFLPINAYAVRLAAVREQRPFFDETLEVLEDWNFLHRLMALRLRFSPVYETLSEFLLTGDGNTPDKLDQAMWDRGWEAVHRYLDQFWRTADREHLLTAWREFDFAARPPLTPDEKRKLEATAQLLNERFPDAIAEMPDGRTGC